MQNGRGRFEIRFGGLLVAQDSVRDQGQVDRAQTARPPLASIAGWAVVSSRSMTRYRRGQRRG